MARQWGDGNFCFISFAVFVSPSKPCRSRNIKGKRLLMQAANYSHDIWLQFSSLFPVGWSDTRRLKQLRPSLVLKRKAVAVFQVWNQQIGVESKSKTLMTRDDCETLQKQSPDTASNEAFRAPRPSYATAFDSLCNCRVSNLCSRGYAVICDAGRNWRREERRRSPPLIKMQISVSPLGVSGSRRANLGALN